MLPRRGWVGWVEEHSKVLGAISVWVFIATGGIGALVASASGGTQSNPSALVSPNAGATVPGSSSSSKLGGSSAAKGKVHAGKKGTTGAASGTGSSTGTSSGGGGTTSPTHFHKTSGGVVSQTSGSCHPTQPKVGGKAETGISTGTVQIGEILSDVNQLPQQLRPSYEGLSAWVHLANSQGGICGRQIQITERNDNAVPNQHQNDYQALASQVFAFVATESLQDGSAYNSNPPFNPAYKDQNTGEYVPDVGGLAFGYPRAQSMWHAGVFGSLSPTLVGGGAYHYMTHSSPGTRCKRGAVVYLDEPTGASKDQADIGSKALAASWGGGLPYDKFDAPLESPEPYYESMVQRMISAGDNCVFTYMDSQSNVNLVTAMHNQGVWPPSQCSATRKAASQCFYVTYMPFTSADARFVSGASANGSQVTTYIPHVPLDETSNAAVHAYMTALAACNQTHFDACDGSAEPSTFSVIGFASGVMFGQALAACGSAPTRTCVMDYLRTLKNFNAGGLIAPITPFECTKVNYNGYDWCYKHIFYRFVVIRELGSPGQGIDAFRRIYPGSGFSVDTLHIVRGSPG